MVFFLNSARSRGGGIDECALDEISHRNGKAGGSGGSGQFRQSAACQVRVGEGEGYKKYKGHDRTMWWHGSARYGAARRDITGKGAG